ncbi:MAG: hypothetical protein ABSB11_09380 [Sedimentisphaerales bacterium]|jgi:hypothetical protein
MGDINKTMGALGIAVAGVQDVLSWGWNGQMLVDELIRLDYMTIPGLVLRHEGDMAQWAPVFMNQPDTWRLLINKPRSIVGYWHFAPLLPEDYAVAKRGRLLDSQITIDKVQFFGPPGFYDIYFSQICMHPSFRKLRSVQLLFKSIFQLIDDLSCRGIFVREICANAYTDVGHAVCRYFHLEYLCNHLEHGVIYGGPIRNLAEHAMAKHFSDAKRRYAEQGLI